MSSAAIVFGALRVNLAVIIYICACIHIAWSASETNLNGTQIFQTIEHVCKSSFAKGIKKR